MDNTSKQSPFEPELGRLLQAKMSTGELFSLTLADLPMIRTNLFAMRATDEELRRGGKIAIEERQVPGPIGEPEISLLICRPNTSAIVTSRPLLPCIYHIHGGGMVAGHNRLCIDFLLDWILEFNIVTISVEYRLAPEHPHPAPSEDCYAGLLWVAANAQDLGIDLSQLSVAGISAGGGLAATMALMARDRGGPKLQGQLLLCPMIDDRDQTFSTHQYEGMGFWRRQCNITAWTALLGEQKGGKDVSPYAAPSRAQDLSNLPPAFIDVASAETFRDEAIDYAQRIWQAGSIVELHVWSGAFHASTFLEPEATLSKHALEAITNWYRRLLTSVKK